MTLADLAAELVELGTPKVRIVGDGGWWNVELHSQLLVAPVSALAEDLELALEMSVKVLRARLAMRAVTTPMEAKS